MRILGIDPGLNTTGYGVIEVDRARSALGRVRLIEAGIVRSRAGASIESRLNEIYSGVREVIDSFRPQMVALEQLFSHYETTAHCNPDGSRSRSDLLGRWTGWPECRPF